MFPQRFIDLRATDHEQRILRLDISIATEHDVEPVLQRRTDREPRLPSHHHRMPARRLTKKLHVRGVVPRQLPTFSYRAFPIDCCNPDDHDVCLYTATGAAILPCDW